MHVSTTGSSITELMAMLQQLYHPTSASTAGSSSSTTGQNAAIATGVANSIAASGYLSTAPLTGDSLLTLLQTQSFDNAATNRSTGAITDATFARWTKAADANGDGTISKSEFEAAVPSSITQAQADQLFSSIDTGGSGSVTASQLRQGLAAAIAAGPVAATPTGGTNRLFEALDIDGDGTITLKEFEKDRASSVTKDQADATFAALDLDGSGTLTPAEFGLALAQGSTGTASTGTTSSATTEQSGELSILSQLQAGGTTSALSLLNGDVANFVNLLDTNQQSANAIHDSSGDLGDFLEGLV